MGVSSKKNLPFLAGFAEPREVNELLEAGIGFPEEKPDRRRIRFEELRKKSHFRFVHDFHAIPARQTLPSEFPAVPTTHGTDETPMMKWFIWPGMTQFPSSHRTLNRISRMAAKLPAPRTHWRTESSQSPFRTKKQPSFITGSAEKYDFDTLRVRRFAVAYTVPRESSDRRRGSPRIWARRASSESVSS